MNDPRPLSDDLDTSRLQMALRSLPREAAGEGFTERVLERIADESPRPVRPSRPVWPTMLAAAAVLVLVLVGARELAHQRQHQASLERIALLRVEQRALEKELRDLQRLADAARPVVDLGADQDVDLVFDLTQLKRGDDLVIPEYLRSPAPGPAADTGMVQPAVFHPSPTY